MHHKVYIVDSGSQYTQLIARRVRELNIFCEIYPYNKVPELDDTVKAIILSGSPFSVNDENAPQLALDKWVGKIPVLGICYGAQYIAKYYGGKVEKSAQREYGKSMLQILDLTDPIFAGITADSQVWMSHGDSVLELPLHYIHIATTDSNAFAMFCDKTVEKCPVYAIQFHPEVTHTTEGKQLLENFLVNIAGVKADWTPKAFIEESIGEIQNKVGNDTVLLALSGGVDSTVSAMLLQRAIGDRLHCFFIDNGLLRLNEFDQVLESYKILGLNVRGIDAKAHFYANLEGLTDPELKRKAIGRSFIEIFEQEAKKENDIKWLAQGTIYPDVIESVSVHGPSVTIKSHHNVGGLPEKMHLKIIEPLRMLFKDEVRKVGRALGLEEQFIARHPFPGPGLGIRILGDITPEKVAILQQADNIFISGLRKAGLYDEVWQAGVILLPVQSVGVMGDERTYENVVALRAVTSTDGMTAEWSRLPYDFLAQISSDIINKVKGVNRVVFDISTKPPATIEWE
ncbi:MAG TPA: glutamine-hydrolyzing GMP synthase [Saprospiraceae bacterium]|nr:glutamine-hydrolyzing GMP synthase [Saprospiraceae bacterium]HQW55845.1 glutamine-hydrolyzing GMP synthase [Saprospiraceae bacterium]